MRNKYLGDSRNMRSYGDREESLSSLVRKSQNNSLIRELLNEGGSVTKENKRPKTDGRQHYKRGGVSIALPTPAMRGPIVKKKVTVSPKGYSYQVKTDVSVGKKLGPTKKMKLPRLKFADGGYGSYEDEGDYGLNSLYGGEESYGYPQGGYGQGGGYGQEPEEESYGLDSLYGEQPSYGASSGYGGGSSYGGTSSYGDDEEGYGLDSLYGSADGYGNAQTDGYGSSQGSYGSYQGGPDEEDYGLNDMYSQYQEQPYSGGSPGMASENYDDTSPSYQGASQYGPSLSQMPHAAAATSASSSVSAPSSPAAQQHPAQNAAQAEAQLHPQQQQTAQWEPVQYVYAQGNQNPSQSNSPMRKGGLARRTRNY